jgi:folate-binding protein YgfZ
MINFCTHHKDRKIIELSGADNANFLQGLITNDVNLLETQNVIYALMLSPQGRFQFELFVVCAGKNLWLLDVEAEHAEAILKKLQMFKLRSDVNICISNEWQVGVSANITDSEISILDPRHNKIGYRFYQKKSINFSAEDFNNYQNLRLSLSVPEGSKDMIMDKSIPLEWNMENLNAISWTKGCYMGQELTARTKHVGALRKSIFTVNFSRPENYSKGCNLVQGDKTVGVLGSSNTNIGIALIHYDALNNAQDISLVDTNCCVKVLAAN